MEYLGKITRHFKSDIVDAKNVLAKNVTVFEGIDFEERRDVVINISEIYFTNGGKMDTTLSNVMINRIVADTVDISNAVATTVSSSNISTSHFSVGTLKAEEVSAHNVSCLDMSFNAGTFFQDGTNLVFSGTVDIDVDLSGKMIEHLTAVDVSAVDVSANGVVATSINSQTIETSSLITSNISCDTVASTLINTDVLDCKSLSGINQIPFANLASIKGPLSAAEAVDFGANVNALTELSPNSIRFGIDGRGISSEYATLAGVGAFIQNSPDGLIAGSKNGGFNASRSIIAGASNRVFAKDSLILGEYSDSNSENSIVMGNSCRLFGSSSIVCGERIISDFTGAFFGKNNTRQSYPPFQVVAIGNGSSAFAKNSCITIDASGLININNANQGAQVSVKGDIHCNNIHVENLSGVLVDTVENVVNSQKTNVKIVGEDISNSFFTIPIFEGPFFSEWGDKELYVSKVDQFPPFISPAKNVIFYGRDSTATGENSIAVGNACISTGSQSASFGGSHNCSGEQSVAFGRSTGFGVQKGDNSFSSGLFCGTDNYAQTSIGYSVPSLTNGSGSIWRPNATVLAVNGGGNPSIDLHVLSGGTVGINKLEPEHELSVGGDIKSDNVRIQKIVSNGASYVYASKDVADNVSSVQVSSDIDLSASFGELEIHLRVGDDYEFSSIKWHCVNNVLQTSETIINSSGTLSKNVTLSGSAIFVTGIPTNSFVKAINISS